MCSEMHPRTVDVAIFPGNFSLVLLTCLEFPVEFVGILFLRKYDLLNLFSNHVQLLEEEVVSIISDDNLPLIFAGSFFF